MGTLPVGERTNSESLLGFRCPATGGADAGARPAPDAANWDGVISVSGASARSQQEGRMSVLDTHRHPAVPCDPSWARSMRCASWPGDYLPTKFAISSSDRQREHAGAGARTTGAGRGTGWQAIAADPEPVHIAMPEPFLRLQVGGREQWRWGTLPRDIGRRPDVHEHIPGSGTISSPCPPSGMPGAPTR